MLLVDELREAWRTEPRDHRGALVLIMVIGVVVRLAHLGQPMRYDESVTYMYFVRQRWVDALSLYTYPNNHLFHTLLAKVSVGMFGNTPWALRLPALVAGALLIPATYAVARVVYGGRPALIAAAIVSSSGVLTLYSTNARGYSLLVLAFLLLVLAGARVLRDGARVPWLTFSVIAGLGLWTVPVMLFPLGTVAMWLTLSLLVDDRTPDLRRLGAALAIAFGIAAVAYAPVVAREGLAAITRNRFVVSTGWYEFFEQLPPTVREALVSWSLGIPPIVSLVLAACALFALRHHAALSRFRVGIAVAGFAWCAWLLVVNHRAPFPRVWLWALPFAASLAGAGAVAFLDRRERAKLFAERRVPALAVAFAAAAALSVSFSRAVWLSRDTGAFREAAGAAALLAPVLRPGDRVLAAIPTNGPLSYYLDRLGVADSALTMDERRANRVFGVVSQSERETLQGLVAHGAVADSAQFGPPVVVGRLPATLIVMFQRRNVPPR